jgi:hypothetical protein
VTSEEAKAEPADGLEKTKEVLSSIWGKTVAGVDMGIEFTREKSKALGEKWDQSETGNKVNEKARAIGTGAKVVGSVAWEKTKSGFTAIKENEKVNAAWTATAETTSQWGRSLWGWVKEKVDAGEVREGPPRTEVHEAQPEMVGPDLDTPVEPQASPPKKETLADKADTSLPAEEAKN